MKKLALVIALGATIAVASPMLNAQPGLQYPLASQGQDQGQSQFNGGNTTSTSTNVSTINNEDYSETYDDYTPPAYAPSMGVSAPCKVGISAGAGIPGISVTGGGYVTDEECIEAESIRMGIQSGDPGNIMLANKLLQRRLELALGKQEEEKAEQLGKSVTVSQSGEWSDYR